MSWNIDTPPAQYLGHQTSGEEIQRVIREVYYTPLVAIDTETTGLVKWQDVPLYFSLAWGNQRATLHADLLPYFAPCFDNPDTTWILANAKYDMHILANYGHHLVGKWHCVQVMHSLLFDDKPHRLKFIAQHLLNWTWGSFEDQFGKISATQSPKELIERAERENMALLIEYAANDAWGTLKVYLALKEMLEREKTFSLFRREPPHIETLWDLFSKVESPFTKVLWKMERRGIKINRQRFLDARPEAEKKVADIERKIVELSGRKINPNSPAQVAAYAESTGLQPLKYTKGGKTGVRKGSWDSKTLEHYKHDNPVFGLLIEHREYSKLLGTYIIGLNEIVEPGTDRIHANFNQDVARCMPAGQLVLTNRGYLPVEDVSIGDLVIAHTGLPRAVIETSKHPPTPIYRVTLDNGLVLRTTGNHEYKTPTGWKRADALIPADTVVTHARPEVFEPIKDWPGFGAHATFHTATVISIEIEPPEPTYGLTVDVDHSHVTGGIVTHNTGRLSSSEPNLQNIPKPENDEWHLRDAFITEPGWTLLCADYSQLEMRLLAAAAQEQPMVDIFLRGWDIHAGNAALMFDGHYDDINESKDLLKALKKCITPEETIDAAESKLPGVSARATDKQMSLDAYLRLCAFYRGAAKSIGFGLNYGMGPGKLAGQIGCSMNEAKDKIAQYKATYPAVERFMAEAVEEGKKYGFAFTILGRRRNIPMIASSNKGEQALGERLAVNTIIQGSAADVTRLAQTHIDVVGLDRIYNCHNVLQVHDELVYEVPDENAEACLHEIEDLMAHPFSRDLLCPLIAECGKGRSWEQAK